MASIELIGITKAFVSGGDKHLAVNNLNLAIADGEFVSLVGPSGCGKSTTLRMIAGLENPDQGRIDINGKDVASLPPQQRDLSMVFQNYAIFPHMTVRQNIGYGLRIAGVPSKEREVRVREVARLVDIELLLDRYPRQLSGGQRQRVAVARAFARDPAIVLLDEPLSNLDAKLRDQTRAELKQLHQRVQYTMVYVTHDQLEALTLSDRIAVMNGGVIEQFASPSEIFHRPATLFVATFIGSPTMNTIPAKLKRGAAQATVQAEGGWQVNINHDGAAWGAGAGEAEVMLGIRPKDIVVDRAKKQGAIPATVTIVEPIGSEVIVHMEAVGKKLVAEVHESAGLHSGDRVWLDFPQDRLHVFDASNGRALYHGSSG